MSEQEKPSEFKDMLDLELTKLNVDPLEPDHLEEDSEGRVARIKSDAEIERDSAKLRDSIRKHLDNKS